MGKGGKIMTNNIDGQIPGREFAAAEAAEAIGVTNRIGELTTATGKVIPLVVVWAGQEPIKTYAASPAEANALSAIDPKPSLRLRESPPTQY